jgi:16S rRNA (cytosine967-C5)-methyltransferase
LLAADRAPHRARLARSAVGDLLHVAVVTADGRRPAWPESTFDRVLVDAPCTGLGALRRRPDARWRRAPGDAARMQALQIELLDSAVGAARTGGVVTYVTCSPHPAETGDVVAEVLRRRPDVTSVPVEGALAAVPDADARYGKQLWPHRHGTDAMYVASLRRIARDG